MGSKSKALLINISAFELLQLREILMRTQVKGIRGGVNTEIISVFGSALGIYEGTYSAIVGRIQILTSYIEPEIGNLASTSMFRGMEINNTQLYVTFRKLVEENTTGTFFKGIYFIQLFKMSEIVPKALYDELLVKMEAKDNKIGELNAQLRREAGLNAAVMARDTLEDFKNKILVSQGYLASEHSDVQSIKVAYRTFLYDSTNPLSLNLNQRIANYPNFFRDVDEFVTRATEAYSKTSRVIHASTRAFRILHSFNDFLNVLNDIPTLSIEEEMSVSLISYVVPYP